LRRERKKEEGKGNERGQRIVLFKTEEREKGVRGQKRSPSSLLESLRALFRPATAPTPSLLLDASKIDDTLSTRGGGGGVQSFDRLFTSLPPFLPPSPSQASPSCPPASQVTRVVSIRSWEVWAGVCVDERAILTRFLEEERVV